MLSLIEVLQCLKCLYHHDLIFWEVLHCSVIEKELNGEDNVDVDIDSTVAFGQGEQFSWDELVADDEGDDEEWLDH